MRTVKTYNQIELELLITSALIEVIIDIPHSYYININTNKPGICYLLNLLFAILKLVPMLMTW